MADGGTPTLDLRSEAQDRPRGERVSLTPTQQAGVRLAWAVGMLITIATVFIVVDWTLMNVPLSSPVLESNDPQDVTIAQTQIENHINLRESEQIRSARMFDVVVGSTLLPVFTAILGYIFGTRQG